MQYLGRLNGAGTLTCGDEDFGGATFEFDGYMMKPGMITASGELRMAAQALNNAFGRRDLRLTTDTGDVLHVRFSGKRTSTTSEVAHVDITEGLPPVKNWPRGR